MQITMSMKEYEELQRYKEKYYEIRRCIKFNWIDLEKNIIDKDNPIAIDMDKLCSKFTGKSLDSLKF
ncbi:hypothetical protein [Clostridium tetani]|uniref:hypothetical protein n=1 Tax=Clostridium tetani TaxID=1513 RepID=UPI00100AF0A6|nr:hypothetical protein [Clostridium tetani]RXM75111.1 hypothetical protein DP154_10075 [Clostridium tetani]RYU98511.1 hypothetical protein DP144_10850 [Clostridium tetani]BDR84889.1 hypothetical protein K254310026_23000 [Clostridium tetani]